jgi:hypothetical protein
MDKVFHYSLGGNPVRIPHNAVIPAEKELVTKA